MQKSVESKENSDYISNGFHQSITTRYEELTNDENAEGYYQNRNYSNVAVGLPKFRGNASNSLGYTFKFQRKGDINVVSVKLGTGAKTGGDNGAIERKIFFL